MDKAQAMKVMAESHRETVLELEDQIYAISETYRQECQYSEKLEEENKRHRSIIQDILDHADDLKISKLEQVMIKQSLESIDSETLMGDCIHCNRKGFNGLDYCSQCNQREVVK